MAIVQQTALGKIPDVHQRYITGNGKQFTGKEFQYFIALHGLTHVRTSPHYPQSNGKVERFHGTIKKEYIRKKDLLDQGSCVEELATIIDKLDGEKVRLSKDITPTEQLKGTKIIVGSYTAFYNNQRLHSGNAYITPADQLAGRDNKIDEEWRKRLMCPD